MVGVTGRDCWEGLQENPSGALPAGSKTSDAHRDPKSLGVARGRRQAEQGGRESKDYVRIDANRHVLESLGIARLQGKTDLFQGGGLSFPV